MRNQLHSLARHLVSRIGPLPALLASLVLFAGCATSSLPNGLLLGITPTSAQSTGRALGVGSPHASPGDRTRTPERAPIPRLTSPDVSATRQAVLATLEEVSRSLRRTTDLLARLEANPEGLLFRPERGLFQDGGLFSPFVEDAIQRRQWVSRTLSEVQRMAQASLKVEDPDMQLALLRLAGPRLEAALCGSQLLGAWVDFLHLAEVVIPLCPLNRLERLFRDTSGLHKKLAPAMTALASLEPPQLEDTASTLPELMRELNHTFDSTREGVLEAQQNGERMLRVKQLVEAVTLGLAVGMMLPPGASAAPAALSTGLAMGSDGMLVGTRVVLSTEWAEALDQLVRAGIISAPVVGAAVQFQAGQAMMSQARDELPKGVREALGEGPEVRGMRQTGRAGAGMSEPPRHHVLPREHREWFEQRGFTGEMDIDQFCVELDQAQHEAIHGGGNWRLGRQWPGEWNQMVMEALYDAEAKAGRVLTPTEILDTVGFLMRRNAIPMHFIPWRGG